MQNGQPIVQNPARGGMLRIDPPTAPKAKPPRRRRLRRPLPKRRRRRKSRYRVLKNCDWKQEQKKRFE